jgi:hypothetical protein
MFHLDLFGRKQLCEVKAKALANRPICKENGPFDHLVWFFCVSWSIWPFGLTLIDSVFRYSLKGAKVHLDLGNVVIQRINTSSKTLEAMLKTYKTCKSPRHEDGTKPTQRSRRNKFREGVADRQTLRGRRTLRSLDQYGKQTLVAVFSAGHRTKRCYCSYRQRRHIGVGPRQWCKRWTNSSRVQRVPIRF